MTLKVNSIVNINDVKHFKKDIIFVYNYEFYKNCLFLYASSNAGIVS